jgi:hypothetical protein
MTSININMRSFQILSAFAVFCSIGSAPIRAEYAYNPNDFAVEVIEYLPGTGIGTDWLSGQRFDDPTTALGRPTVDTTGDNWYIPATASVPVVAVHPPFRADELVTIGNGGRLTVKFDHAVANDPLNPFGIDLIIFGNASQQASDGSGWTNSDPSTMLVGSIGINEPAVVSVSQGYLGLPGQIESEPDTWQWHTFDLDQDGDGDGHPAADTFAPTLGRIYDPDQPDTSLGTWNEWWGRPTNPTVPIDPSLDHTDLAGMTVAEIAESYRYEDGDFSDVSAGGTGFDLDWLDAGVDWIQYVRITGPTSGGTPEIDALADVAPVLLPGDVNGDGTVDADDIDALYDVIGSPPTPLTDFNDDGMVNQSDVRILVEAILGRQFGDANLDGIVDEADLSWVADGWKQPLDDGARWARGDFSGDRTIDEADLAYLADNWKQPAVVQALPEPTSLVLMIVMGAAGAVRRRCRR